MPEVTKEAKIRDDGAPLPHHEDEIQSLSSWIGAVGSGSPDLNVRLVRKAPRVHLGQQTDGLVGTFAEPIDEEYIKDIYGGGTYTMVVQRRNAKGIMQHAGTRTFRIAGHPKVDADDAVKGPSSDGSAVGQALEMARWTAQKALEEKKQGIEEARRGNGGTDISLLKTMQEPMLEELRNIRQANAELQKELARKDERMIDLVTSKKQEPEGPRFEQQMMLEMFKGESARIETLRTQHASELRQLKESHQADLRAERERWAEERRDAEKRQLRELDALKDSHKNMLDSTKLSWETRVESLQRDISRLEGDNKALKVELAELKAKKEKTLPEQAQELLAVKEALGVLGGDEDDEEGKSIPERLFNQVMQNPEGIGQLIGGLRGAPQLPAATEPSEEEQMQAAEYARQQQLTAHQHTQQLAAKKRAKALRAKHQAAAGAPAAAVQEAQQEEVPPPPPSIDPNDVAMAVQFMEAAVQSGTPPEVFAQSAKTAVPGDIIQYIRDVGVENFLSAFGTLSEDSPLNTQRGRRFAREVAKHLLAGG